MYQHYKKRGRKHSDDDGRHNETKVKILLLLATGKKHYDTDRIARMCGITPQNAAQRCGLMFFQGYIWRKKKNGKKFLYRRLKPMGWRTLKELWIRMQIKELTGDERIELNLKKSIPWEHRKYRFELAREFETLFPEFPFKIPRNFAFSRSLVQSPSPFPTTRLNKS